MDFRHCRDWIIKVLNDIPQRDSVEVSFGISCLFHRPGENIEMPFIARELRYRFT
jgi:hypothetical protein